MDDKKKKKSPSLIIVTGILAVGVIASAVAAGTPASTIVPVVDTRDQAPAVEAVETYQNRDASPTTQKEPSYSDLSNDNYYTNVDGNEVHSPAYSETGCAAVGASAECRDGTCSFSQNRRGTCSHHGGVAEWL